jgi:hypothetical protein
MVKVRAFCQGCSRTSYRYHFSWWCVSYKSAFLSSFTNFLPENIIFRPSTNWRKDAKEEKTEVGSMKDKLKDKKVKCRICNGEHFTARCPFKDTMAPVGEEGSADVAAGPADVADAAGGLGSGKSSYVPPHLRNGAAGGGDRMGGGKFERSDESTLRVTNVRQAFLSQGGPMLIMNHRYQRWQKSKSFGICSSVLVGLRECSLPRIGRLVLQRVSRSSVSKREQMPLRLVRRWTVMDSSI